jgi:translocator assembly and maintenance protein 41
MESEGENFAYVTKEQLKKIVDHFPTCVYAFAYGSAVFPQKNNRSRGSMIDLVFVTDDPVEWHRDNLEKNACHYSGMRYLGPNVIADLQEKFACGVYYNTYAVVENFVIKYGVMSTKSLEKDLTDWEYLYVAGRLHKPVIPLISALDSLIPDLIKRNRLMALHAALLALPESTSKVELYRSITSLSYTGDCRMLFGEDPNKVENIVAPIMDEFDVIYDPLIDELFPMVERLPGGQILQKTGFPTKLAHLQELPFSIQESLSKKMSALSPFAASDTMLESITLLASDPSLSTILSETISSVVLTSSIRQTLVGFVSTGILGSLRYALDKVLKKTVALSKYYSSNKAIEQGVSVKGSDCDCDRNEHVFDWSEADEENFNKWNKSHCSFLAELNGTPVQS